MIALLGLIPLIIGGVLALITSKKLNTITENIESWFRSNQASNNSKSHWIRRIIMRPLFFTFVKFFDWTDSFKHNGVKNGVRIASMLYLIIIWIGIIAFLAFMAIQVLIAFALLLILWFLLRGWLENKGVLDSNKRRPLVNVRKGEVVNPDSGKIEKDGLWGKEEVGRKIDLDTGEVFENGIFGWQRTGIKVDQKTGIILEDGLFGYTKTSIRIHPESGVIQENGLMGWSDTSYRVNPETGRKQKNDAFGWRDL